MSDENLIKVDENGVRHCTQCKNECPENDLHCGRGRKLFNVEAADDEKNHGDGHDAHHEDRHGHEKRWHHGNEHGHEDGHHHAHRHNSDGQDQT